MNEPRNKEELYEGLQISVNRFRDMSLKENETFLILIFA